MENRKFKSSDKAKEFLNEAKMFYDESKYFEALASLNKSLCFSEENFQFLLCFELRSRVYFAIGQHEKCLKNVQQESDFQTLSNSEESEDRKIGETSSNFFKLSHPPNPKNPSIISCLKLCVNDKFGRHIVTTKRLKAGDVIAIEKPLHKSLDKLFTLGRCVNCFSSNLLDLLPCKFCTSVMFCSNQCRESSWKSFHKFECNSIDEMTEEDSFLMMIQRTLFEILSVCGGLENLQNLIEENPQEITAFDCDMNSVVTEDLKRNLILICQSLECAPATKDDLRFATSFVDHHEHLTKIWKTEKHREFLIKFVVKFIGIMNRNAFTMHWKSPCAGVEEQGCAIFPTISMLNHSCSPNLFRIRTDGNLVLIARKPIEENEQLFIAYQ